VTLRSAGGIAHALGADRELEVSFPATVATVLRDAACVSDAARASLFAGGRLVPSVWRGGERLAPEDEVHPGDELALVTAIAGG
jgi:hypothetical protein